VGGPACKSVKTQGFFKLNGSAEPWISGLTTGEAVDRAVVAVYRSTVDRPHKMKGYAISSVHRRLDGRECVQAGVAVDSPECGGARRKLAGVAPGQRSWPSLGPRAGAFRSGGACARDRGVRGDDRASSAASTGRGRSGRSGELVSALLRSKGRGNGLGLLLTVACRTDSDGGSGKRSEGAGSRRRRSRRRSDGR
jgi:hypothetical protein